MVGLFEYVNDISQNKKYIMETEADEKDYSPFMVNRAFSLYMDTIRQSAIINANPHLDKKLQHDFLFYTIQKRKRFSKWPKKLEDSDLELVSQFYKYSLEKARQVLPLLSKEQLAHIKRTLKKGGQEK